MALQYYNAAVSAGSGNGVPAGVFFPVGISTLESGEISNAANSNVKESKVVNALLTLMLLNMGIDSGTLGISTAQTSSNVDGSIFNTQFAITVNKVGNTEDGTYQLVKAPTIGDKTESSIIALKDISASIAKIAAEGAISGEGFLVPTVDLVPYGSPTHADLDIATGEDNRAWFAALVLYLARTLSVRSATKSSAITSKSIGNVGSFQFDANADDPENPSTGYTTEEIDNYLSRVSQTILITVQSILNFGTQKFEINVTTV